MKIIEREYNMPSKMDSHDDLQWVSIFNIMSLSFKYLSGIIRLSTIDTIFEEIEIKYDAN